MQMGTTSNVVSSYMNSYVSEHRESGAKMGPISNRRRVRMKFESDGLSPLRALILMAPLFQQSIRPSR